MNKVLEIQAAIENLPTGQRRKLVQWIESRQRDRWDHQIASDIQDGKLEGLLKKVRKNIRSGKLLDMP